MQDLNRSTEAMEDLSLFSRVQLDKLEDCSGIEKSCITMFRDAMHARGSTAFKDSAKTSAEIAIQEHFHSSNWTKLLRNVPYDQRAAATRLMANCLRNVRWNDVNSYLTRLNEQAVRALEGAANAFDRRPALDFADWRKWGNKTREKCAKWTVTRAPNAQEYTDALSGGRSILTWLLNHNPGAIGEYPKNAQWAAVKAESIMVEAAIKAVPQEEQEALEVLSKEALVESLTMKAGVLPAAEKKLLTGLKNISVNAFKLRLVNMDKR
ncbi:hypothetical protein ACOME3_002332 [Neoechinorhynchus agilis]